MYNGLFSYASQQKILYLKEFGFQACHSTEHAILQLANQIHESFEKNLYTLGVFIDLCILDFLKLLILLTIP